MNESEKLEGRPLWRKKLYMKPVLQNIGAIDLGFKRKRFTWENNQEGNGLIKERIDKALVEQKLALQVSPNYGATPCQ